MLNMILHSMIKGASLLNADLYTWGLSQITSLSEMFYGATTFNGDVSSWNTS